MTSRLPFRAAQITREIAWRIHPPPARKSAAVVLCFFHSSRTPRLGLIEFNHLQLDTFSRSPLEKGSVRRRDLRLYTQHSQQTSMRPAGFELAIPATDRPQTLALDRSAIGVGSGMVYPHVFCF